MSDQTGFKFQPIESVVRSCINWAIKWACSSLLYTCMIKHCYYRSIHKVWKGCYEVTILNHRYTMLFQKSNRYNTETSFITPYVKQYLSIIQTLLNDLLLNTSENQILLVVRLLERCHNNSTFTLRLLQGLTGNLIMLRKRSRAFNFCTKKR